MVLEQNGMNPRATVDTVALLMHPFNILQEFRVPLGTLLWFVIIQPVVVRAPRDVLAFPSISDT